VYTSFRLEDDGPTVNSDGALDFRVAGVGSGSSNVRCENQGVHPP